ncbi:MAG: hemolysin family protein, partial [Terriglobales bacterium]
QFGITIASLGLGWAGEPFVAHLLEGTVGSIPYVRVYSTTISFILAFVLITYLHVILGEVVPKSVALQRSERVALAVAAPMDVFMTLVRPFLVVMSSSARLVLRLFGSPRMGEGSQHSPEEIRLIATASRRVGLLPAQQEEMLHRVLDLSHVLVREIMVPRTRIFSLSADLTLEEAMAKVVEEQHSRVPVFDPKLGPEHIVGVLYSKDISRLMHAQLSALGSEGSTPVPTALPVRRIMRGVLVVPETKPVADLLAEFKKNKRHLAVVVDEFGTTSGVVTVEDVLEQIVGEIEDEFDVARLPLPLDSGALVLDGGENIRDLEIQHHLVLPRDQGFETLGGFVLAKLERIPRGGEMLEYEGRRFTVLKMDGLRIAQVKVEPVQQKLAASKPLERAGD